MNEDRQRKLDEATRILETLTEEELNALIVYLEQLENE